MGPVSLILVSDRCWQAVTGLVRRPDDGTALTKDHGRKGMPAPLQPRQNPDNLLLNPVKTGLRRICVQPRGHGRNRYAK
jgi:hypothetical protein